MTESLTGQYIRDMVARMPREERLRLFMQGVGADEESNLDVLREALAMPEPDETDSAESQQRDFR